MGINFDSDFLLVQKMRLGDETALQTFVAKYYPGIRRYCQLHISDRGYAEDMTQETFARFFKSFKHYQHYGKAANYLYVTASSVCSDYYRKKQLRSREILAEELPETACESETDIDTAILVRMALDSLPDEIRETAVLFFVQEQKQKDIARILGIGLPLVKYRIRRARELLSAYLKSE